jgi:HD-GYP domain-containing protein (c-di-GMP phosphodiesterase class II)
MSGPTAETDKFDDKLLRLSSAMDEFEGYGESHARRMASLADAIASDFNIAIHDRFFLQQAALVHDIGEVDMGRDYIASNRVLTGDERIDLQRHPVIGEQSTAAAGLSRAVQLIVRWHHEWWNGGGYPDGLEGEQIPLAARILRVADTYASLVSARPFRAALTSDEAHKHMIEWAGIEFDPVVVKAFLALRQVSSQAIES